MSRWYHSLRLCAFALKILHTPVAARELPSLETEMDESLFQKNLQLLARLNPDLASRLLKIDCSQVTFCSTKLGEPNLQKIENDQTYYLHSPEGARKEAQQWLISRWDLPKLPVLFIYGLGLGYYYDALKGWLKQDPKRYLIFFENDLRILHRFLETEKATEILNEPQVIIQYFDKPIEKDWSKFRKDLEWFFWSFAFSPFRMSVLKHYEETEYELIQSFCMQIDINFADKRYYYYFHTKRALVQFESTYLNYFLLPESHIAQHLDNTFTDIPAIICEAGPL